MIIESKFHSDPSATDEFVWYDPSISPSLMAFLKLCHHSSQREALTPLLCFIILIQFSFYMKSNLLPPLRLEADGCQFRDLRQNLVTPGTISCSAIHMQGGVISLTPFLVEAAGIATSTRSRCGPPESHRGDLRALRNPKPCLELKTFKESD